MVYIKCWGKEYVKSELPWNAWSISDDGRENFELRGWWNALEHLLDCRDCRKENNLTLKDVRRELKQLEREWEQYTSFEVS